MDNHHLGSSSKTKMDTCVPNVCNIHHNSQSVIWGFLEIGIPKAPWVSILTWFNLVSILKWLILDDLGYPNFRKPLHMHEVTELANHLVPIGSMYAIYGNIYHQYIPNDSISADPGLGQGRGGAWDHRRCGTSPS